jgi:formylmethanofuran dehydrogenase subunit B
MTLSADRRENREMAFTDVACTVCGCVCDDLEVKVVGDHIAEVKRACRLAEPWFESLGKPIERPRALVDGEPASLETAAERAAEILKRSRAPLIWGLSRTSTAGHRAAVALAEKLGGTIDTATSLQHASTIIALQHIGESTCTLGEVRHRADLVIFWGADPVESHPRHLERFSGDAAGMCTPNGRADRRIVVIDANETATGRLADEFIRIPRERNFELVWALRMLVKGLPLPPALDLGVPHETLQAVAKRLRECRYGALFYGAGFAQGATAHAEVEGMLRLVGELNAFTRFTVRGLGLGSDLTGAEEALCWLTGFPIAVNFARSYPRYSPGEFSANEMLERGEVDACLVVGSEPFSRLSEKARDAVRRMPTIVLDPPNAAPQFEATVQVTTAIYGVHAPGTAYRMDGVAIPLRAMLPSRLPTDDAVLEAIAGRLTPG